MTGARITIDHNLAVLTQAIEQMIVASQDTFPMLDEIGSELVSSTQERFDTGRGPNGVAWPVSDAAIARGGQTLKHKTRLVQSITHNASADAVEIGTNVVYAAIHQFGGKTGRNHSVTLPERAYLGFSDEDELVVSEIIADYIRDAAGGLA